MKFHFLLFCTFFTAIQLTAFNGNANEPTACPDWTVPSLSGTDSLSLEGYLKSKNIEAEITEQGVYYKIDKYGSGEHPKPGDYVMVKYKGMLMNGTVFDESKEDEPFVFQLGYRHVIVGWEYGIPLFQVGSKGRLFVPAEMAYGHSSAGVVPPNSPLIFEIELVKIMNFDEYDDYMVAMEKKARKAYEARKKKQFETDKKLIQEYLIDKKIKKSKRLPSGVSYAITKKGKGENAKAGDILKVEYTGYLLDGSSFDASEEKKPYQFQLGKRKVIQGWEDAFPNFKKGSEGWILVPSKLAYGPRPIEEDNISIPGNSVLVFKVKVVEVKSGK